MCWRKRWAKRNEQPTSNIRFPISNGLQGQAGGGRAREGRLPGRDFLDMDAPDALTWAQIMSVMKWPLVACLLLPGILVYYGLHILRREVIFVDLALAQDRKSVV